MRGSGSLLRAALALAGALSACLLLAGAGAEPYRWRLPAWAPLPLVPADNPMSAAKVELGRHLFYDKRLSADGSMACATCHRQALAFTDGRAVSPGVDGRPGVRSAMPLANAAYLPALTWANPNLRTLEVQALVPLFGEHPVEMGMAGREEILFATLRGDPRYPAMFRAAFPEAEGEVSLSTVTKALAAFQRTLISLDAPYDRYRYGGQRNAISAAAKRGEALFFGEKLECYHCHAGFNFTDNQAHARLAHAEVGYHNNGLYNVDGRGAFPADNPGLREVTGRADDEGKFRTPTLRNVALTAPYMHDGSIATLREVLEHYAAGGRTVHAGPNRGVGARNPNKSPLVAGFQISEAEMRDVIAFLESLTDQGFVTDPRHADPFAPAPQDSSQ
jgi:cytochrome c peroxidase